ALVSLAPPALPVRPQRDPRGLSSFPTRRSSDLESLAIAGQPAERAIIPQPLIHQLPEKGFPVRNLIAIIGRDQILERLVPPERLDRKSTRLNSSHVKSSYAVFCLKKKKNVMPVD